MNAAPISDLPAMTTYPALDGMPRAGSTSQQIALQNSAWEMVETCTGPSGHAGTRMSNAWLGARGWAVQLFFYRDLAWRPGASRGLVASALRNGQRILLGTAVSPAFRPTAVWRLPTEEDSIERFFEANSGICNVVFAEDRSFAVHGSDGDFCTFAGPESFIRAALPADNIGPSATAEVVAEVEKEYGLRSMDGMLAHYQPFML
jgi:hypothetical protein